MIKNLIIVALITINAVFVWAFLQTPATPNPVVELVEPAQPNPITAPAPQVTLTETALPLEVTEGDYASTIDQLRAAGMDESILRQIMLATINRDHLLAQSSGLQSDYWRRDEQNREDKLNAELDWELERREQLISLFGAEIIDDPLFMDIFKPLNDTLSFLSSDKQIRLDEIQRRDEARTQNLFRNGFTQESRTDLMEQRANLQREISELLSQDESFEYQLRESRLSDRMRRGLSSFDYSESEFRDIFSIRQINEGNELSTRFVNRTEFREQREQSESEIRDYLGDSRYEEYARSQDPTYRSLQSIGDRYGNSTAEINNVYEIAKQSQDEISELRQRETLDREERIERINEIRAEAYEEIERIAGKETADSVRDNSGRLGFGRGRSSTAVRP